MKLFEVHDRIRKLSGIIEENIDPQTKRKLDKALKLERAGKEGILALPREIQSLPGMLEVSAYKILDKILADDFKNQEAGRFAGEEPTVQGVEKRVKAFSVKHKGKVFTVDSENSGPKVVTFGFMGNVNKSKASQVLEELFPAILGALEIDTANFKIVRVESFDEFIVNPGNPFQAGDVRAYRVKFDL